MTKQQIFDKVWDHFVIKKSPQSESGGDCLYRGDMTPGCPARCAAGLFIPDELYDSSMEGHTISGAIKVFPEIKPSFQGAETAFWMALQSCHDSARGSDFHERVKYMLTRFANGRNLTIPSNEVILST